jgi:hypothetical protein
MWCAQLLAHFFKRLVRGTLTPMKTVLSLILFVTLAGCSVSAKDACQKWLDSNQIYTSYDRCLSCAKTYGTKDLHSVRSCTFKRDIEEVR